MLLCPGFGKGSYRAEQNPTVFITWELFNPPLGHGWSIDRHHFQPEKSPPRFWRRTLSHASAVHLKCNLAIVLLRPFPENPC